MSGCVIPPREEPAMQWEGHWDVDASWSGGVLIVVFRFEGKSGLVRVVANHRGCVQVGANVLLFMTRETEICNF